MAKADQTVLPRSKQSWGAQDSIDPVGDYLLSIGKVPLLSAIDEVELAKTIEAGLYAQYLLDNGVPYPMGVTEQELGQLVSEGAKAQKRFIMSNLLLVVSVAKRYNRASLPLLDIIQEGNLGLIRAVQKFDFTRGYKFSTYATWWIRQSINRAIQKTGRTIKLPGHQALEVSRMVRVRRQLSQDLGREPDETELSEELGITLDRLVELQDLLQDTLSLNWLMGESGRENFSDFIVDTDAVDPDEHVILKLEQAEHGTIIERLLDQLNERTVAILRARYSDSKAVSREVLAEQFKLSRERIRQIEVEGLAQLRELWMIQVEKAA